MVKTKQNQIYLGDVTDKIFKLSEKIRSLIVEGDRCLILSENRPYWLMTDISIMNAGGILFQYLQHIQLVITNIS